MQEFAKEDPNFDPKRNDKEIWELCKALGMSSELLEPGQGNRFWGDFDIGQDGDIMRQSDKVIAMIAQAVIYGADVILLSSVIDIVGPTKAAKVLRTLHKYVRRRGWFMARSLRLPHELRHEKTLLYTTKLPALWEDPQPDYLVTQNGDSSTVRETMIHSI
jgi:hypothetical protein